MPVDEGEAVHETVHPIAVAVTDLEHDDFGLRDTWLATPADPLPRFAGDRVNDDEGAAEGVLK